MIARTRRGSEVARKERVQEERKKARGRRVRNQGENDRRKTRKGEKGGSG